MKWIKASADKPQHYQKVFVRKTGHEGGGFATWDGIRKVFINDHLFGPRGGDPKDFEWLDESQPSSDQIVGMRNVLEKMDYHASKLEDVLHGEEGKRITEIRFLIVQANNMITNGNQSPSTGEQEEWNRNERYETRLALHKMIKVLETKDVAQTESNLRLVAQDILKKYSKPEDVLR